MWAYDSIFYQIYPLGFCGAPEYNDGRLEPRLNKIRDWIPYLREMEINALYLSPVFQSDRHGYDTRDYRTVDARLGTNDDLIALCEGCHREGIRIILDGVFHHVGRGFWAFQEVQRHRWDSPYKDWFF
ncbi:MAG TPA: alpha-amylase family glycosyl hydrolase, partial [Thermotogota bacterium]|nr:alpha-amylase family glycosyl hydrolase [Thermotogota bacterium]